MGPIQRKQFVSKVPLEDGISGDIASEKLESAFDSLLVELNRWLKESQSEIVAMQWVKMWQRNVDAPSVVSIEVMFTSNN